MSARTPGRGATTTMSTHQPFRPPTVADPAAEADVDVVAGDPPVPITVWRTPAGDRLAHRLLAAYTRRRDYVIDLTDTTAIAAAAASAARHLHVLPPPATGHQPVPGNCPTAHDPARKLAHEPVPGNCPAARDAAHGAARSALGSPSRCNR